MTESRKPVALWWLGLVTLAYFLAGKLGLSLAVVNASVSPGGATVGASSVPRSGDAKWPGYPGSWFTWWLGDAVGALVVGPVLVLWSAPIAVPRGRTRQLERVGLFATVIAVCGLVFYGF